jgi:hypothetical protein
VIRVKRPSIEVYHELAKTQERINIKFPSTSYNGIPLIKSKSVLENIFKNIEKEEIINIKEFRSFRLLKNVQNIPKDIFNIICDNIIQEILTPEKNTFTGFRDTLYDILTYNLDMTECLWYILRHFIEHQLLNQKDTSFILIKTHRFLKYYNNNYRPIYHLEFILYYIMNKIHKLPILEDKQIDF